eukprot:PhM_4_TR1899/c0_g1_i2/m.38066
MSTPSSQPSNRSSIPAVTTASPARNMLPRPMPPSSTHHGTSLPLVSTAYEAFFQQRNRQSTTPQQQQQHTAQPSHVFTDVDWKHRQDHAPNVCTHEMNQMVMEWLTSQGFRDVAEAFQCEAGVKPNIPLESMDMRVKIREAIESGDVAAAMYMLNNDLDTDDNDNKILSNNPDVAFSLFLQQLIEMLRCGGSSGGGDDVDTVTKAMDFARDHIAPLLSIGTDSERAERLNRLEQVMSLLAYDAPANLTAADTPNVEVLSDAHRQHTASMVNAAVVRSLGQAQHPRIEKMLRLMVWTQNRLVDKGISFPRVVLD